MVKFNTTILKYGDMGEKTGWTFVVIPADLAAKLKPGNKKSFRVKGKLDDIPIAGIALLPIGAGEFILTLNAALRKKIGKRHGAGLSVQLTIDNSPLKLDDDLMLCLNDDKTALEFFNKLSNSHQRYFSNWINSAKTDSTKAKRIAQCLIALSKGQHYGQMLQSLKQ